jgi:hypothetical protein
MSNLFEEADIAADILRRRPGFVPEDLRIMFRLLQLRYHPNYSDDEFSYVFQLWRDGHQARRAVETAAAIARMLKLLKERDALTERREKLPLTERVVVTERIASIAQEIAAMLGPEKKPPTASAQWP